MKKAKNVNAPHAWTSRGAALIIDRFFSFIAMCRHTTKHGARQSPSEAAAERARVDDANHRVSAVCFLFLNEA